MASLQTLVNNLLVWQSSCASKLRSLKAANIFVQACRCSAYNQNIDKRLARNLVRRTRLRLVCISVELPYSGKFSERNIFGNLNESVISEIKFRNVAT